MNAKTNTLEISGALADSMDQSIGEVTTVMGAMITELMRRSLRGGVVKIGEELQTAVIDKVDAAVAERLPEMERAAIAAAEQTAQLAAAKVAAEEVYALDVKTGETARRLESQIEGVGQQARGAVEEKALALAGKIDEVDRRAAEATAQLNGQLVAAEKRVCEVTQSEIDQRLACVVEKSRAAATALKARLKAVEEVSEAQGKRLHHLLQQLEASQARLKDEAAALRQANAELAARVAELEKPKGIFARWFGKRKDKGEGENP